MNFYLHTGPGFHESDGAFDAAYPLKIQKLSFRHWTPLRVAQLAADYLVDAPGTKVLDIGSGAGKFCMLAAAYSKGQFTGVERRENLVRISIKVAHRYKIERVNFIHADIRSIDFSDFDAFYFFNSFEENLDTTDSIDGTSAFNTELFQEYSTYTYHQFEAAPLGTKIVTYCTASQEIPASYILVKTGSKGKLKFWQKSY